MGVEVGVVALEQEAVLALERREQVEQQVEPVLVVHVSHLRILEGPLQCSYLPLQIGFHR